MWLKFLHLVSINNISRCGRVRVWLNMAAEVRRTRARAHAEEVRRGKRARKRKLISERTESVSTTSSALGNPAGTPEQRTLSIKTSRGGFKPKFTKNFFLKSQIPNNFTLKY